MSTTPIQRNEEGNQARGVSALLNFDPLLFLAAIGLVAFSLMTLHSAGYSSLVKHQALYAGIGLLAALLITRFDYTILREFRYVFYGLAIVLNLAVFNGGVTLLLVGYAVHLAMPLAQIAPLVLVAVLASIPVALPSMFTLAATVGARAVARRGVLPTRLSALDEAAGMDVLCADKTGTLTQNALAVTACRAMTGFRETQVLAMATLASSDGGAGKLRRRLGPARRRHSRGISRRRIGTLEARSLHAL